jgi:hypothetical protein
MMFFAEYNALRCGKEEETEPSATEILKHGGSGGKY